MTLETTVSRRLQKNETKIYERDGRDWNENIVTGRAPAMPDIDMKELFNLRKPGYRLPAGREGMGRLVEALISNPDASNLMRDTIRYLAFRSYAEGEALYTMFTTNMPGPNTQSLAFSGANFNTAYNVVRTMRDRTSGAPGTYVPDTLICSPLVEFAIRQQLRSTTLAPQQGNANPLYGQGTSSQFASVINRIIVSPFFGDSYEWAIFDSSRVSVVYQELEPMNVIQQTMMPNNDAWFSFDSIKYRVTMYFGIGFVDDRPWFYSPTSDAPTVA